MFRSQRDGCREHLVVGGATALPLDLRPDFLPVPSLEALVDTPVLSPRQPIQINLLSPTRLLDGKRLLADGKPIAFALLVARTLDRYFGIFHSRGEAIEMRRDLEDLESAARRVPLVDDSTKRHRLNDYSTRSRREIRLDGRKGTLTYGPKATPFLPVLRLAEILHIGKNPSSGCGRVQVRVGGQ